jgi:hypothetical protein
MKLTQNTQKLTSMIALVLISSNAYSAINIFTPTGGAFTGTQSQALYWDMLSNNVRSLFTDINKLIIYSF